MGSEKLQLPNTMIIPLSVAEQIMWGENPDGFKIIVEGDWSGAHKCEYQETIVSHLETGKLYRQTNLRALEVGRLASNVIRQNYAYEAGEELIEVRAVQVVKTNYQIVTN